MTLINGHEIYVETHGPQDGPVVLLLHHGLGSVQSWEEQSPILAQAGFRTIAYDRWGYGHSARREHLSMPYFDEDLRDLQALFAAYEIEKAVLVGHSDGGTIALYFAARFPQQVAVLVTVAAHIYVEPKMRPGIEAVRDAYVTNERFVEGMLRLHGDKADVVFRGWFHGWMRPENREWDMRPTLGKISCPTLVVQGEEDEHTTPQHARDLAAAIPKAKLWLVPEAGHMLPQDYPEMFNQKFLAFLDGNLDP